MQAAPLWKGWLSTEVTSSAHLSSLVKVYTVLSTGFMRCYQEEQPTFPFGSRQMFEIDLKEAALSVNVKCKLFSVEKLGSATRIFRVKTDSPSILDWQQAINSHIETAKTMPDAERYRIETNLAHGGPAAVVETGNNNNNNPNAFVATGPMRLSDGTLPPPELTTAAIGAVYAEGHDVVGTLETVIESIVFIAGDRVLNLTIRWEAPEPGDLVTVGLLAVQSVSFAQTSPTLRRAMDELVIRANYGLRIGSFILDPFEGGIIFRSELPLPHADQGYPLADLTHMVKPLVLANIKTHERYCPAIEAVINGEKTPEDAIATVEGKSDIRAKTDEELRMLHETFIQLLNEREIPYELKAQTIVGYSRHEGDNLYVTFVVDESSIVYIKSHVITTSPSYARTALGELAMRATKLTTIGEYNFDYSDGQVLYQTELPFLGVDTIDFRTLLEPLLDENLSVQRRFLPAFQAVIRNGRSAIDALSMVPGLSRLDIIGGEAYIQEMAAAAAIAPPVAGIPAAAAAAVHVRPRQPPAHQAPAPQQKAGNNAHHQAHHPAQQHPGGIVQLDPSLLTDCQRELGTGGMGTVYLCQYDGVEVAVKQLNSDASTELMKEMTIQAKRQHKNLVRLKGSVHCNIVKNYADGSYTITPDDKSVLMVMEYCSGGSLRDWLRQLQHDTDCFFELDVLTFVLDIAEGMAALHNDGVVHRDLKPENIFLEADLRRAKIGDFGLAKQLQRKLNLSGAHTLNYTIADRAGTLFYMAPECFLKGEITRATDIFAFGIILHNIFVEPDMRKIYDQQEIIKRGNYELNEFDYAFANQVVYNNLRPAIHEPLKYQVSGQVHRVVTALMTECWDHDPSKRPNFSVIVTKLSNTIGQLKRRAKFGSDSNVPRSPGKAFGKAIAPAAVVLQPASVATPGAAGVRYLVNTTIIELDSNLLTNCRERLGSGGMGEVYLCEYDGTPVAVKQLKDGSAAEILHEMSVQSKKSHKNLVHVLGALYGSISDIKGNFDILRNNQDILMIMEYCPGGSLRGWLNQLTKLTRSEAEAFFIEKKVVRFILDVAEGMAELHRANDKNEGVIVHRDLKPENILFHTDHNNHYYTAKIGDFGLAKQLRRQDIIPANGDHNALPSLAYTVIDGKGSRFYMAPECYSRLEYTRKADVFAFAIVLHNIFVEPNLNKTYDQEKIIGTAFYPNQFDYAFQYKLTEDQLRPEIAQPTSYRVSPLVHESMASLMERCWNHNPKLRPDFVQIVQELRALLAVVESVVNEDNKAPAPAPLAAIATVARPLYATNVIFNPRNFYDVISIHQTPAAFSCKFRHGTMVLRQVADDERCYALYAAWSIVQATSLSDHFVEVTGLIRARIEQQQGDIVANVVADSNKLILVSRSCQQINSLAAFLSKIKDKTVAFDERQLLDIAVDVVIALLHLHNLNIALGISTAHNIMLESTSIGDNNQASGSHTRLRAKINDFSHAKLVSSSQEEDAASPQADDVWTFGCLLYSIFISFDGISYPSSNAIITMADLSSLSPMLGKVISDLIKDCWLEDPRERPSLSEIAVRLQTLQSRVHQRRLSQAQLSAASSLSTGSNAQVISDPSLNVMEKATSGAMLSSNLVNTDNKKPLPNSLSPIEIVRLSPNRQQTETSVITDATPESSFFLRTDRMLQTSSVQSAIIPQSSIPFQLLPLLQRIRVEAEVPEDLDMAQAIAKVAEDFGEEFADTATVRQKVEHLHRAIGVDLSDVEVLPVFFGRNVNLIKLINAINDALCVDKKLSKVDGMQKAGEILGIGTDCSELKTAKQKAERVARELGILVDDELSPYSRSDIIIDR